MSFFSRRRDLDTSPGPSTSSTSLRKRVSIFTSRLVRSPSKPAAYSWAPRSPSRSPSPPSPDIRRPSGLGRRASLISLPLSPLFPPASSPSTPPLRGRTLSSPHLANFLSTAPRLHPALLIVLSYADQNSLASFALVSRAGRSAALPLLYSILELDAPTADACIASIAAHPPLATLVRTFAIHSLPASATFALALNLAMHSMRHLTSLTLPNFSNDLLSNLACPLRSLTLFCATLPASFYTFFLPSQPTLTHLSLPNLISQAISVSTTLDALCGPPSVVMALAPRCKLSEVKVHVDSTLYDGLRPAALMDSLAGVRTLRMVLGRTVDARTRARLVSALGRAGDKLEVLTVQMDGSDESLYKQISALLPHTPALRTIRLLNVIPPPIIAASPPPTPSAPASSPPPSPIPAPVTLSDSPGPPPFLLLPSSPHSPHPSISTTHSPHASLSTQSRSVREDEDAEARESAVLGGWGRHAPDSVLRRVVFWSGGVWEKRKGAWARE